MHSLDPAREAVGTAHFSGRILNLRDLGGLRTTDGRKVARGRLYRSGTLHDLTEQDGAALAALGIRTVLDLRSDWERRSQPCAAPVRVIAAPMVDDRTVMSIHARFDSATITSEELEDWWNLTRVFQAPQEHIASLKVVFDTLLAAGPDDAVLFHCRGGKDRTGLVAAFVLDALGVTWEDIVADFLRSNLPADDEHMAEHLAPIVAALGPNTLSDEAIASLTSVKPEWLEALFHEIGDRYGSVSRYLTDHVGIGAHGLARLRVLYLEGASR